MADKKISELTALTGANVATDDQLVIVDTSAALTKSITMDEFKNALDTATGFVRITGDTMTGALDVQSTITADGLTVGDGHTIGDDGFDNLVIESSSGENIRLVTDHATLPLDITSNVGLLVQTALGTDRFFVDSSNGDISFYEDTGTTAKFFWDASAESLGIGTSSPSAALEIVSTTSIAGARLSTSAGSDSEIEFINTSSGNHTWAVGQDFSNSNAFSIAYNNAVGASLSSNAKVVIDSSGRVGIGAASPS